MIRLLILSFFSVACFSKGTVYCLHGFLRSSWSMEAIATDLKIRKFRVTNWDYPSRSRTIDEHAEALLFHLKNTAKNFPGEPIHFVTHSMGGLVVRRTVNLPGCPVEAREGKAVLIAPPNRGSTFAHMLAEKKPMRMILGTQAGRELMEMDNFDHLGQFPPEMDVLVIAGKFGWNPMVPGKNDGKVTVAETKLSTPHKHIVINAGHSWISYAPRTIKETHRFLKN